MSPRRPFGNALFVAAVVVPFLGLACRRDAPAPMAPGAPAVSAAPVASPGTSPLRIVVQTRSDQDAVALRATLAPALGTDLEIEPLFPGTPAPDLEGLNRMFLVRAANGLRLAETDWDAAYRVAALPEIARAEPDTFATLEVTAGDEAAMASCKAPDDIAPADTAWSLRSIRAPQAWTIPPPPGGSAHGEGVSVCHPDTGWTTHAEIDPLRLDRVHALDLLTSGGTAQDPLESGGLFNPGHGTATGSVIASGGGIDAAGGTAPGRVTGVAPGATVVPIRAVKSVVQAFDSDIARAVRHSVGAGCSVISMSLGGRWFFGLHAAIRDAVSRNVIVTAAAGNCVRFVVAPASFDESIAVAGVNIQDRPWRGSSRGRAVDISGPAEHVWVAVKRAPADPDTGVAPGQGTSFAVASVAGSAALWVGQRGAEARAFYGTQATLQDVFRHQLRATARRPMDWDAQKFGAGIVDVERLIRQPLPPFSAIHALKPPPATLEAPAPALLALERTFDIDRTRLVDGLSSAFDIPRAEVGPWLVRWGPELVQRAMEDPADFYRLFEGDPAALSVNRPAAAEALRRRSSRALQQASSDTP